MSGRKAPRQQRRSKKTNARTSRTSQIKHSHNAKNSSAKHQGSARSKTNEHGRSHGKSAGDTPEDELQTVVLLFNKPFQVLCQFTNQDDRETLANYIRIPELYAAGRLDRDSEGLLLLTNNGMLQHRISHPDFKLAKTYLVQVEGEVSTKALKQLGDGVKLNDGLTAPAQATRVEEPDWLWPRNPPIRFRKDIPTSWIKLTITEGRNRQVRRMSAAVGYPTLRLVRIGIGMHSVEGIVPGEYKEATAPFI